MLVLYLIQFLSEESNRETIIVVILFIGLNMWYLHTDSVYAD